MKLGFFEDLKQYLLEYEEEHLTTLIPYYETLLQHQDKLTGIIDDYDKYQGSNIQYIESDEHSYAVGTIYVSFFHRSPTSHLDYVGYSYEIELSERHESPGYCQCKPEDDNYNQKHHCCGYLCDYTFPEINIRKVSNISNMYFEGYANELWELEKKWDGYLASHNEEKKKIELERIEERIAELEAQRELLK